MKARQGSATVLVLLLTAALTLVATAFWRGTRAAHRDAVIRRDALQARLAAEGGMSRTLAGGSFRLPLHAPLGASVALPGVTLSAGPPPVQADLRARRLSSEMVRIESTGRAGSPAAESRVGALIWRLDPGRRLSAYPAVATTGQPSSGAGVRGDSITRAPSPWTPSDCAGVQPVADSVFPTGNLPPFAVDTTPPVHLGLLDRAALLRLGRTVTGVGTPGPVIVAGGCDRTDPWNWGSPTNPSGPCGVHRPLVVAPGSLTVAGGEGQGVLVADGSVRLTAGTRFHGLIIAGMDVVVDQGSRVAGLIRAGGRLVTATGGHVTGSACPVLHALSDPLYGVVVSVQRGWLDPL